MKIVSFDGKSDAVDIPAAALGVIIGADPQTHHLLNELDRFGFPLHATLLQAYDLRPEVKALARDVAETLQRLLGPNEARREMLAALKQPKKGKCDNRGENALRLAAYDNEIGAGTDRRQAARRAAERVSKSNNTDVESIARHIRDLVKQRDEHEARKKIERSRVKVWGERIGASLLERAVNDDKAEF